MNNKKPIYEKMWFWVLIVWVMVSIFIAMCIVVNHFTTPGNIQIIDYSQQENNVVKEEPIVEEQSAIEENSIIEEEPIVEEIKSKYLTKGNWALYEESYAFSIENDSYNGDNYKSGVYDFTLIGGKLESKVCMPAMFGVYVLDKEYSNIVELKQELPDATFYVGGLMDTNFQYELKPGQFVYIVPEKLVLKPTGFLEIVIRE